MVFIFFGLVSVLGVFQLYGLGFEWLVLFPAITIGLWSTAVLNLNNLRDIENDRKSAKKTMVVKLGFKKGKIYHAFLIVGGALTFWTTVYFLARISMNPFLFLSLIPSIFVVYSLEESIYNDESIKPRSRTKEGRFVDFFHFRDLCDCIELLNLFTRENCPVLVD